MRKKLNEPIYVFSFFLLGLGLTLIGDYFFANASTHRNNHLISCANILNSFYFFYPPFLYFFALSINKVKFKRKQVVIHLIPFASFLAFNTSIVIMFYSGYSDSRLFDFFIKLVPKIFYLYFIQVIIYTIVSFKIIKKQVVDNTKNSKQQWQTKFILMYNIVWFFFLLSFINDVFLNEMKTSTSFKFFAILFLLILSNLSIVMLMKSPEIFFSNLKLDLGKNIVNKTLTETNYQKLCNLIQDCELFKNSELKVTDLSKEMKISGRNISALIKTFNGTNFNDYINTYRIEEAKRLLQNSDPSVTILSILFDSGFNSKSVFNTTFKKTVGLTPTDYRKQSLSKKFS